MARIARVASAEAGVICGVTGDLRIGNVVDVTSYVLAALVPEEIFWG
jgi:acetamidase/formamidase